MAPIHFMCKECSKEFSGPVPYMYHLQSARHQKKVATRKQLDMLSGGATAVQPFPFNCNLCNVAMSCEEDLRAHNEGKKHQRALQTEEFIRRLGATRDAGQELPLATVAPRTPPTLAVAQPPQEQLVKQPEENGEVIDLSCRFCGIVLFEDVIYKLQHLETAAHRERKMQVTQGQAIATSAGIKETNPAAQEAATLNKEDTYIRRAVRNLRRLGIANKKPNLPVADIKVIVRPKDGFSTATHRAARIGDGIRYAPD
ncbi:hypothetical protein HPB50_028893 [Hyalomma asiaticum]|nr:hypothetical protein HPB50_028893 [Hyalomma asiaticum]